MSTVAPLGFDLLIAEHVVALEATITEKVVAMMESCDIALILLTQEGFDSKAVQQEIGYLRKLSRPLLLVVQEGLEKSLSMFAYGRDYILIDPANSARALERMREALQEFWSKWHAKRTDERLAYERAMQQARLLKAQQEQETKDAQAALWVIGGLVLVSMMSSNTSSSKTPPRKTTKRRKKLIRRRTD